ncbi:gamma-glutamylcyclotransferase [Persicobacter psychrovividus]|uniref:Gamma-glutamylcyclotransferase AIG2-like domain-containing protein n=1 Tax=Persicobacter psychrovividus TaxID=387638 RepID=A0ABM7VE19_9BACT|nr:hypothetical protein PEPS_14830 [Persicobacter psychrovividus]
MTTQLFLFGPLTETENQLLVFGKKFQHRSATLDNFTICCDEQTNKQFLRPAPSCAVSGIVVEIEPKERRVMELWEGKAFSSAEILKVKTGGSAVEAIVYIGLKDGKPIEEGQSQRLLNKNIDFKGMDLLSWYKNEKCQSV